ncbi:unnamed protein product [Trypanosoma congolense IL3000]|uniref:WGS project CAEQ00000000 data, annotated contig 551 n=1 Tax=Trypanosoma congolense (strain IL3000) TaxID=1068625 RepID=F9WGU6_TRYCI|nr:unnamed protein product [Trypanosoma congolense IL3000]
MPKVFRVCNDITRLALVDFLVDKRTRFLEHLRELSSGGSLWMGTVQITKEDVVQYFGTNGTSSSNSRGDDAGYLNCKCEALMPSGAVRYRIPSSRAPELRPTSSCAQSATNETEAETSEVVVTVEPITGTRQTASAKWISTFLPCYFCLAMSLGDLLQVGLPPNDFANCLHALLLEINVRFATGTTERRAAQSKLRDYRRQHCGHVDGLLASVALEGGRGGKSLYNRGTSGGSSSATSTSLLDGHPGGSLHGMPDMEEQSMYFFMDTGYQQYTDATHVSYEQVMAPLCAQLVLAYRSLGSYESASSLEKVRNILAIDRYLQHIFFVPLSGELSNIAHRKLLQEITLLSSAGLFSQFEGVKGNVGYLTRGLMRQASGLGLGGKASHRNTKSSGGRSQSQKSNVQTSGCDSEDFAAPVWE